MAGFKLHPVHMLMVHFPSALLPMDLVFGVIAIFYLNDDLARAAYYCLVAGTIGGWVAVITGMVDLFSYILKKEEAIRPGFMHAGIQTAVIIGFTVLLSIEYKNQLYVLKPPVWMWICKSVLLLVMLAGNYLGGELLMKYVINEWRKPG